MGLGAGQIAEEADFDELAQSSTLRPAWRLVQATAQTLAHSTDTAITFGTGSTVIDTHNFHDEGTNPSRVTPNVAGLYVVRGVVYHAATTNIIRLESGIALNGAVQAPRMRQVHMRDSAGGVNDLASDSAARTGPSVHLMVQMNGTTDYLELIGAHTRQTAGSLDTVVGGSFSSVFEGYLLRE